MSSAEAEAWLLRGHRVQLICEATPWFGDPGRANAAAAHFMRRSFAALSGSVPVRVAAMLVAWLDGPCPNLSKDMRCGIYPDRPLVCRIYPAEVNPAVALDPGNKQCPPEAWTSGARLSAAPGEQSEVQRDIGSMRMRDAMEAPGREHVCAALGITAAGLVHEAAMVYSPSGEELLSALGSAPCRGPDDAVPPQWSIVSNEVGTLRELTALGATVRHGREMNDAGREFFNFRREPLFRAFTVTGSAP